MAEVFLIAHLDASFGNIHELKEFYMGCETGSRLHSSILNR